MRLEKFLKASGWSDQKLAEETRRYLPRGAKTSTSTINRLRRTGDRRQVRTASVELAMAIEQATGGQVRAEELPLSATARRLLRQVRSSPEPAAA